MDETYRRVALLLSADFGVPVEQVQAERALGDLSLDSLALEELRSIAEDRFGVDLEDAVLSTRHTVADLVAILESALPTASAAP
ncbi:acyl carrier protein [Streptomyces sp. NPDC013161]|uniref:acyl carrier protein n=1 Tax=Streptomyces sp. NPDC013161 TaxID=3364862 RepID=UPI0036BBFDAD